MRDHSTDQFPRGHGPRDDVLAEFGVDRQGFLERLRQILLHDPPIGLDDADVSTLLLTCVSLGERQLAAPVSQG